MDAKRSHIDSDRDYLLVPLRVNDLQNLLIRKNRRDGATDMGHLKTGQLFRRESRPSRRYRCQSRENGHAAGEQSATES